MVVIVFEDFARRLGDHSDAKSEATIYRGWMDDAKFALVDDVMSHSFFNAAASTIAGRVGISKAASSSPDAAVAVASTLARLASIVSLWPSLSFKGASSSRLIAMAASEYVRIMCAVGACSGDADKFSRVMRLDIVCGKGGAYGRFADEYGIDRFGPKWREMLFQFSEAETINVIHTLAVGKHIQDMDEASEFVEDAMRLFRAFDEWQMRSWRLSYVKQGPNDSIFESDAADVAHLRGWCREFSVSPVTSVLPTSTLLDSAESAWKAYVLNAANAGKTPIIVR